ncbi:hypothetical protein [Streptomyces sp. WMMB 322]|uniref:hypothetical protein n=1 Tax=Streptomyces sp. WMMB 322 TaxID=1286821 RepID=UPI000823EFD4|nr:hypothetical protein H180DRAFT_00414 [Streptomyces sp. WMMB 322]
MPDRSSSKRSDGTQQRHPVEETVRYPLRTMTTAAEKVPGAERVKGVFDDMLDTVGIVSPRARRVAAYTGAGILGLAGVVEWPVAAAGAAAVWLTQPRPADTDGAEAEGTGAARTEKPRTRQSASTSGNGSRTARKRPATSTAKSTKSTKSKSTASAPRAKAGGRKKS